MRKKDLVTYQLKAYQDLKYRANRMTNNDAEIIDVLPDVPEKRKFKPDYLKDDREKKKERTLKLRNLSDFSKADNQQTLADNLKEANSTQSSLTSSVVEDLESKNSTSNTNTGYNFLSRRFSLNLKTNSSSSHGSTVDVDVIEVSSSSSYSEDEEDDQKKDETKDIKEESKKSSTHKQSTDNNDADDENEDVKNSSSVKKQSEQDDVKTNVIGDKVDDNKLPVDPNVVPKKDTSRVLKRNKKSKNFFSISKDDSKESKHSSIDFSSFINNLTFGNNANKRNGQQPMTASNVINSIFSFLNSSIKEEKPVAPIIDTPKSPPIPESSQESGSDLDEKINENHDDDDDISSEEKTKDEKDEKIDENEKIENTKSNTENGEIIAPIPVHVIPVPENLKDNNDNNNNNNNNNNDHDNNDNNVDNSTNTNDCKENTDTNTETKDSTVPIITVNDNKEDITNKDLTSQEKDDEKKKENGKSLNSSKYSLNSNRSNARMDFELQPTTPEEIRKKKLTPLIVSKKGASVLIKFLERNINVVPEMKITEIEWVCMQNPRGTFTTKRPQCPGQRFPGLKMGRKISNLMISLAKLKGNTRK
ncbi:hypothetical protein PIROE2DRAFT_6506 [Piromyces sp. E2]|nr:hypothetical protein PIROE2DRAFT_6506 [Piromyces sp. E2]|eukprot:OUM66273.1 hypothetical protein PIROE2DRAFT_6506 [Piromyces sp. E2]